MPDLKSVTELLHQLKSGDRSGVQELWERYFHRLVGLARKKLQNHPKTVADEEDIALSAFKSFCLRAEEGKFPKLDDREDLWRILTMLTSRKASGQIKYDGQEKRDWHKEQHDEERDTADNSEEGLLIQVISKEPDPAFVSEMMDQCNWLLKELKDEQLKKIALWKLEGRTNEEIASEMGCSPATIERRLHMIRCCWGEVGSK
jgi:DNA-directed RNA polymerase specialized sigma24 family protein